jgi:hypothetical protein
VIIAGAAFGLLAALSHRVPYFDFDVAITRWVQQAEWPVVTVPLNLLSAMGFPPLVAMVYGVIAIVIFIAAGPTRGLHGGRGRADGGRAQPSRQGDRRPSAGRRRTSSMWGR